MARASLDSVQRAVRGAGAPCTGSLDGAASGAGSRGPGNRDGFDPAQEGAEPRRCAERGVGIVD